MVKVRGQNLNRNTVKHTAEKSQKISGDDDGGYYVTGARRQEFVAVEWSWNQPGILRQIAYELNLADNEHFESLAWPCMMARWYHWHHNACTFHFFAVHLAGSHFNLEPSPSDSTEKGKRLSYVLEVVMIWRSVFLQSPEDRSNFRAVKLWVVQWKRQVVSVCNQLYLPCRCSPPFRLGDTPF